MNMFFNTLATVTWKVNPVAFRLGSMEVRWYGILLALGFLLAYYTLQRIFKTEHLSQKLLDKISIWTIVWTIILLILGVTVICFSFRYAIKYEFECTTFLVDHKTHLYHSDWNDVCEKMQDAEDLELMHGYEIDDTYSFCKECREAEAWLSREWIHK